MTVAMRRMNSSLISIIRDVVTPGSRCWRDAKISPEISSQRGLAVLKCLSSDKKGLGFRV